MSYIKINRSIRDSSLTFDPTAKPPNDAERINALRRYKIFDSPSEEIFSVYTELTALTFQVPIGLMSFVDEEVVHYKQAYGVPRNGQLVPRKNSPCSIAIMSEEMSMFRYALTDPCVLADEGNLAEAGYKFYAGAPLKTKDGFNIGMLAAVDRKPRDYSQEELQKLQQLSTEVMREVEIRLKLIEGDKDSFNIQAFNERLIALHKRVEALRT